MPPELGHNRSISERNEFFMTMAIGNRDDPILLDHGEDVSEQGDADMTSEDEVGLGVMEHFDSDEDSSLGGSYYHQPPERREFISFTMTQPPTQPRSTTPHNFHRDAHPEHLSWGTAPRQAHRPIARPGTAVVSNAAVRRVVNATPSNLYLSEQMRTRAMRLMMNHVTLKLARMHTILSAAPEFEGRDDTIAMLFGIVNKMMEFENTDVVRELFPNLAFGIDNSVIEDEDEWSGAIANVPGAGHSAIETEDEDEDE